MSENMNKCCPGVMRCSCVLSWSWAMIRVQSSTHLGPVGSRRTGRAGKHAWCGLGSRAPLSALSKYAVYPRSKLPRYTERSEHRAPERVT